MHLSNILENELDKKAVCKDFLHTAGDGKILIGKTPLMVKYWQRM